MERQTARAAEKERVRKQQIEERKRRQREEIEKANVGEDEKRRLLKEHEENMKKLEVNDKVIYIFHCLDIMCVMLDTVLQSIACKH